MDELTNEFLVESQEGLDRMERCLAELEARPGDAEMLADIFRAVHTIKGATGFLALPRLEKLAHAGEHLLGLVRDGSVEATPLVAEVLLKLLDGLRHILGLIEMTGCEGTRSSDDDTGLISVLQALHPGGGYEVVNSGIEPGGTASTVAGRLGRGYGRAASDHTLRVKVETLNRMMNQVGELVLTRNQIVQSNGEGEQFQQLLRRLDDVTAELQDTVMRARTQPVEQLFQKFPRMVRDLARQCGRSVRLEFTGQETRLDKSLLDALKDPITHAIRNAVDHGVEPAGEREQMGKSREGTVWLRAYHEGGQVVIEVADDGCGIDAKALVNRAVERGLISLERSRSMSEQEALHLVFLRGFSTRDEVTTVSGRGVGMDVVRASIESAGGMVEMASKAGQGSTLRMRVPLTLAIISALVVQSGDESFLLPRNVVSEVVKASDDDAALIVEGVGCPPILRLRGILLPLVELGDVLRADGAAAKGRYVAVVEIKGRRFGLVVDKLLDSQEIVVKPISHLLRQTGIFSGASILGNGELALILDVAGIAARAHLASEAMASVAEEVSMEAA